MESQRSLLLWLILVFSFPFACGAQTLSGLKTSFDGEKIVIQYDLNDGDLSQKYRIQVFSSYDGYAAPLTFISGDVGENIIPGKLKRIEWEVRKVLPSAFDSEVSIKLRAVKIIPPAEPLKITGIDKTSYKKGNTVNLQWSGGGASDKVNIELLKGTQVIKKTGEGVSNTKSYSFTLPDVDKGNDYALRITNLAKPDDKSMSTSFTIKSKMPLVVKLVPIVVVGAVVAVLVTSEKSPSDDDGGDLSELPGPVKP